MRGLDQFSSGWPSPREMLDKAVTELQTDHFEAFKALILGLVFGLRRSEMAGSPWNAPNLDAFAERFVQSMAGPEECRYLLFDLLMERGRGTSICPDIMAGIEILVIEECLNGTPAFP